MRGLVPGCIGLVSHLIVPSHLNLGGRSGTQCSLLCTPGISCLNPLSPFPTPFCPHLSLSPEQQRPFWSPLPHDSGVGWGQAHPLSSPQVPVLPWGLPVLTVTPHLGSGQPSLQSPFTSILVGLLNYLGTTCNILLPDLRVFFQMRKLSVWVWFPRRARPKPRTGR